MTYKVLIEKEYYKINNGPSIGLLMMVKNESKRIDVSLKSVLGTVDALIIYDTGSTDNTIEIIKDFSEKNKINLYLIQGSFIDFSTSRNVSLEYADKIPVTHILLLDCNDELQGGEHLKEIMKTVYDKENTGFLVCQKWWNGSQLDKYFNIRFVKNRCGWRYRGSVHEWMKDTSKQGNDPSFPIFKFPDNIILFQDRTKDDDKSAKRFDRDRVLLLEDYKKDPKDTRTLFYLAQTCECLRNFDEALYYSKLRLELQGFDEELFHSYMRCGNSCMALGHDWEDVMKWYMKGYNFYNRVEPLIKIADYYKRQKKFYIAYMFAKQACELTYPQQLILFVDSNAYEYYRWHLMGSIAYYVEKFTEGKIACIKAIEKSPNKEIDTKNLQFYLDMEAQTIIGSNISKMEKILPHSQSKIVYDTISKYNEAKNNFIRCLEKCQNKDLNFEVLQAYLDKEKMEIDNYVRLISGKIENTNHAYPSKDNPQKGTDNKENKQLESKPLTRQEFMNKIKEELQVKFPFLSRKNIDSKATILWKDYKNKK